jgi:hypothetical protein
MRHFSLANFEDYYSFTSAMLATRLYDYFHSFLLNVLEVLSDKEFEPTAEYF